MFRIHDVASLHLRDQIYQLHGYVFAIPALIFYYLLYKSELVPRWLSIWGAIASLILIVVNLLELAGRIPKMEILYLPIILNEGVLALWLIFKGFNNPADRAKAAPRL